MTPKRFATLRRVLERRQTTLTVLMENVHKPHNYAAVLRSCDAVGVLDAHAISSNEVHCRTRQSEAAASAADWVRVHIHDDLMAACHHLKQKGFTLLAAHRSPKAVDFRQVNMTRPTAIMLGAELDGLSEAARAQAEVEVAVPMVGVVESLNVSVAAALLLFEAQRQRQESGAYERQELRGDAFGRRLFEWAHPRIAEHCQARGVPYPALDAEGTIVGDFPR